MPYRATPDENRRLDRATRKAGMRARVMAGAPVGLLAYAGGEPIGWCSIAPRATFPRPNTSAVPGAARADDASVWSLTCFFVPRRFRGCGLASRLLRAAIAYAREQGALGRRRHVVRIDLAGEAGRQSSPRHPSPLTQPGEGTPAIGQPGTH